MRYRTVQERETFVISIRLDDYDDVFSDFDIRPYIRRSLSVDFIDEVKRAARDKQESGVALMLHVPKRKRKESREVIIRERLTAHFRRHYHLLQMERGRIYQIGTVMVILGMLCMVAATTIIFNDPAKSLFLSFLVVFLEPAAWFLLWEGMDQILFVARKKSPDLGFYRKMSHAESHIYFRSY